MFKEQLKSPTLDKAKESAATDGPLDVAIWGCRCGSLLAVM